MTQPLSPRRRWALLGAFLGLGQFLFLFSGADLARFPLRVLGAPERAASTSPPCGPVFLSSPASGAGLPFAQKRPGPWGGHGHRSRLAWAGGGGAPLCGRSSGPRQTAKCHPSVCPWRPLPAAGLSNYHPRTRVSGGLCTRRWLPSPWEAQGPVQALANFPEVPLWGGVLSPRTPTVAL